MVPLCVGGWAQARRRFCRNLCEPLPLTRRNTLSYHGCDEETQRAGQDLSTGPIRVSYITLTTDFGVSPGVMKGVIWRIAPDVQLRTCHTRSDHKTYVRLRLHWLDKVYYFPENTIHVAVVDPGVGTARRPIAAQIGRQRFVGPDNGIFTPMFQQAEQLQWPVRIVHTHRTSTGFPR